MLRYYRQSLIELFSQIQLIKNDPYGCRNECLCLQESLIKKITYVEGRIRKLGSAIRTNRKKLRTARKDSRLAKEEAERAKEEISRLRSRIDEYKYLLVILRDIGNGVAFAYIDKWDIKPMAFKESPGFISRKKGARRERRIWRAVFEHGIVAILNDLTHCLRYGDITVPRPDGRFTIIEVKSSEHHGGRTRRQIEKLERIVDYIHTDHTDQLYQLDAEVYRVSLPSSEVNHRDEINHVIRAALKNGSCLSEVERGLFYLAVTQSGYNPEVLDPLVSQEHKSELWTADLKSLGNEAYYPYTLSICDPQALYMFYEGTLSITVMVDSGVVVEKLKSRAFDLRWLPQNNGWALEVASTTKAQSGLDRVRIGYHFLNRLFAEFWSLNWYVEALIKWMEESSIAQIMHDA
jgi:hypothetical protein